MNLLMELFVFREDGKAGETASLGKEDEIPVDTGGAVHIPPHP